MKVKISSSLLCVCALFLASPLASCTLFTRPAAEPSLVLLTDDQVSSLPLKDDLDNEELLRAVSESIHYFRTLSPDRTFQYGGILYSPEEMAASLNLFLETTRSFQGEERILQLRKKFLFFESRNARGNAFFTGYYEPTIEGTLEPSEAYRSPVYEKPNDLIEADLGQFREDWKNEILVGRLDGNRLVPYDSREEIAYHKSLENRARPLAYANEIELFFLQIQGSGLIRLPDGGLKRVNYAGQNGHPYRPVGRILKDRIPPGEMSMQSIKEYLYAHPDEVRDILSYNQSYTFFREVDEGPLGDIQVPLTPGRSIAMDRRVIPRGGLAYIETALPVFDKGKPADSRPLRRFVLVQDTGGAIRGHGRVDVFFGHDHNAELLAGHLKQEGRVFLVVARKEFLE